MERYTPLIRDSVANFMHDEGLRQIDIAKALNVTPATLSRKLNGYHAWTIRDLVKCYVYGIPLPSWAELAAYDSGVSQ